MKYRSIFIAIWLFALFSCHQKDRENNTIENRVDTIVQSVIPKPGLVFANHKVRDVDNNLVDIFDSTKVNLVIFWASWCLPCWAEAPMLKKIYTEYGGNENLHMISVSIDEDHKDWLDALDELKLNWEQTIAAEQCKISYVLLSAAVILLYFSSGLDE